MTAPTEQQHIDVVAALLTIAHMIARPPVHRVTAETWEHSHTRRSPKHGSRGAG